MNRADFQALAQTRLDDAAAPLRAGRYSAAYYLAGYAVECGLKACIAKSTNQHDFPAKHDHIREYVWTHNLTKLLKGAGLDHRLKADAPPGSQLDNNWAIVLLWSENSRYEAQTQQAAQDLYAAIAEPNDGVLRWLQKYW